MNAEQATRVAYALLDHDADALRRLAGELAGPDPAVLGLRDAVRAGLARLVPEEDDDPLTGDDVRLLRTVSGHPGLTAAELAERLGPAFSAAAPRLLERGLVTSTRFERTDCWTRTARGAAVLREG